MGSEQRAREEVGCGGNDDVDVWSHKVGQNMERKH